MTVIATRPCVTCGRGFPVPANNPAKRYCTPRCRVADWRHRHPGHARRQPASRRDAANAVSSPNAVAPGDAVPRCPHCGRAVAVVTLLLPPAAAHVTVPQPIGGQHG